MFFASNPAPQSSSVGLLLAKLLAIGLILTGTTLMAASAFATFG